MQVCSRCSRLLSIDARTCPEDNAPANSVAQLSSGVRVGAYVIQRLLGEGGMGVVYEAKHEMLNRRTAMKFLRPEYVAHSDVVRRFLQEARAVNVISHDNIVSVYDFADGADGSVYYVMEFLDGETLGDLMHRQRQMPPAVMIHVYSQILRALAAAHAKQIIHRDLKPVNVFLIRRADNPFFVKLLDFGIAQLRGEGATGPATRAGTVMGTPQFMSPEQISGKPVDARTDLWSLGVMLYRAATGVAPFKSEEFADVVKEVLMDTPPAPRTLAPALPQSIERLIMRALEKDRDRRWASANEMLAELDLIRSELGITEADIDEHGAREASAASMAPTNAPASAPSVGSASMADLQGAYGGRNAAANPTMVPAAGKLAPMPAAAGAGSSKKPLLIGVAALVVVGAAVAFMMTRKKAAPRGGGDNPVAVAAADAGAPAPKLTLKERVRDGDLKGARAEADRELGEAFARGELGEQGQVLTAITQVGSPRLAPILYLALEGSPELRRLAARALRDMKLPDAVPKLRAALANSGEKLKVELAATLVMLGDPDGLAILKRAVSEPGMRGLAAGTLAAKGDKKSSEAVLKEIFKSSPAGREQWRAAAEGLLHLGDAGARQALVAELAQPDATRAVSAAELLARAGDADARGFLARVSGDRTFARRGEAALALARLGDEAALVFVPVGLASADPAERALAVAVAGRLPKDGAKGAVAVAALSEDSDRQVRLTVRAALVAFD